ncbi:IS1595 family transposase [Pseudaestuariivita rosea]|uniref:IS1595 family transposase n=1 Tax=Pseudaestuariivita rosea TaxID=2763263 RepID=UPI001ABA57BC|nr:IS1595 family transposase [Pseudaestuariivita rosea]
MNKKNGLSRYRRAKLIRAFAADLSASQAAEVFGRSRTTVNRYYRLFREAIAQHQRTQKDMLVGTVELDESYFGATRLRGAPGKTRRGRGTSKQPVFGIFERGGRVFTEIVPDTKKATLQALIRDRVAQQAVVVTDGWKAYDGLVDVGYDRHLRIKKARPTTFSKNGVHINGIESFWSFTKRRLTKFNGVPPATFELHLKECEWRWGKSVDILEKELKTFLV